MKIENLILSILSEFPEYIMSWGTHNLKSIDNGITMNVKAFKFEGKVEIKYISNRDLFRITLINNDYSINHIEENIPIHEIIMKIDKLIELVPDYNEAVKNEYNL